MIYRFVFQINTETKRRYTPCFVATRVRTTAAVPVLLRGKLRERLTVTFGLGEPSLIAAAAKGGSPGVFSTAVGLLDGEVRRLGPNAFFVL